MSWGRARSGLHVGTLTGRNESCLPQTSAPSATTGGYRAQIWRAGAVSGIRGRRRASAIALFQASLVTGDIAFLTIAGSARAVCSSYVSPKIRYNFSWFWDRCRCITARCSRRLTRLEGLAGLLQYASTHCDDARCSVLATAAERPGVASPAAGT